MLRLNKLVIYSLLPVLTISCKSKIIDERDSDIYSNSIINTFHSADQLLSNFVDTTNMELFLLIDGAPKRDVLFLHLYDRKLISENGFYSDYIQRSNRFWRSVGGKMIPILYGHEWRTTPRSMVDILPLHSEYMIIYDFYKGQVISFSEAKNW